MCKRVTLDFAFNFQHKYRIFVVLLGILYEIYEGKLCMEVEHCEEMKTGIVSRMRGLKNSENQRVKWMVWKEGCPGNKLCSVKFETLSKSCIV